MKRIVLAFSLVFCLSKCTGSAIADEIVADVSSASISKTENGSFFVKARGLSNCPVERVKLRLVKQDPKTSVAWVYPVGQPSKKLNVFPWEAYGTFTFNSGIDYLIIVGEKNKQIKLNIPWHEVFPEADVRTVRVEHSRGSVYNVISSGYTNAEVSLTWSFLNGDAVLVSVGAYGEMKKLPVLWNKTIAINIGPQVKTVVVESKTSRKEVPVR